MKILYIADLIRRPDSGAAGADMQILDSLRTAGHQVEEVWADALPHRIRHGNLHYLLELPLAYRDALKQKFQCTAYDVTIVNQPHGYLAARYHRERGLPGIFVQRSHGIEGRAEEAAKRWPELIPDRRPALRRLAGARLSRALAGRGRKIAREADGFIVGSTRCATFLNRNFGVGADRIIVLPIPPPEEFLENPPPRMTSARLRRILYVGQFTAIKAPGLVADVMKKLGSDENVSFTWVCSAADHARVRHLLGNQFADRVRLLDWRPQGELISVFDEHGVLLFPSLFEGFGRVVPEAMARGVCVVASDSVGAADVVAPGSGFIVPTGDAPETVRTCEKLLSDPLLAAAVSERARAVATTLKWQDTGARLTAFFQRRLDLRNPVARRT